MSEEPKLKFFITHSWSDKAFTQKLGNDLRAHGFEGFLDIYSVKPGDNIPIEINRGLEACDVYIPILSSTSLESTWCEREISAALMLSAEETRRGRPHILPILCEDCANALPPLLKPLLYIQFHNRYDAALEQLLAGIKQLEDKFLPVKSIKSVDVKPAQRDQPHKRSPKTKPSVKPTNPPVKKENRAQAEKLKAMADRLAHERAMIDQIQMLQVELTQAESRSDWNQAIIAGEKILVIAPSDQTVRSKTATAYITRATLARQEKKPKYDQILADANRAIELDPHQAEGYHLRAGGYLDLEFYEHRGDYGKAIADLTQAINLQSSRADYYFDRGQAYANIKDWDHAIADYNQAIHLDPSRELYYMKRGAVYREKGNWGQALADATRASGLPTDAAGFSTRGDEALGKNEYDQAIAFCTHALELDPRDVDAYYTRGVAYNVKKKFDKAVADLSRAIEIAPKLAGAYFSRGLAFNAKREYDKSIADFTQALTLKPKEGEYYCQRGIAYGYKKDYAHAIADLTRAIELEPKNDSNYKVRGVDYHNSGDYVRAIADYSQAINLAPSKSQYYFERAKSYRLKGDRESARRDMTKAVELGNQDAKKMLAEL
ncbi:MAG: tetratricopeptide repeat protein [Chloroflexi bacterium]|nr:tetratricopeptide repeat protein [Chloroflexota bacterium]